MPVFDLAVARLYRAQRRNITHRLVKSFPREPYASCEEAASEAFCIALEDPRIRAHWESDGDAGLLMLLHVVAWRVLRGEWRTRTRRQELLQGAGMSALDLRTPEGALAARQTLAALPEEIHRAAVRFAPRSAEQLKAALTARLLDGGTDVAVARAHGVRREALNRARNWLLRRAAA